MKKPTKCWLAALVAAAAVAVTFLSPRVGAEESGPGKAANNPPEHVRPAASGEAASQPASNPKRETYPFRGKVASFDADAQSLVLAGKTTRRVVQLTAQTRLVKQGQPAVTDDLKAGEEVGGTLRKTAEGREEAVLIRIGPKAGSEGTEALGAKAKSAKKEEAE